MKLKLLYFVVILLGGCDHQTKSPAVDNDKQSIYRGYTKAEIRVGEKVFKKHCQTCHGLNGQGLIKNWQKKQADGNYPAPPLNGTAHTWHHDLQTLLGTINRGGIPIGGIMPAFKSVLSNDQKIAVLGFIQSLWSDEVYQAWLDNNN